MTTSNPKATLLVVCDPEIQDYDRLATELSQAMKNERIPEFCTILSSCPYSGDTDISKLALSCKVQHDRLPIDWSYTDGLEYQEGYNKYGKAYNKLAPYHWNEEVSALADAVFILWQGKNKAIKHLIKLMNNAGKQVHASLYGLGKYRECVSTLLEVDSDAIVLPICRDYHKGRVRFLDPVIEEIESQIPDFVDVISNHLSSVKIASEVHSFRFPEMAQRFILFPVRNSVEDHMIDTNQLIDSFEKLVECVDHYSLSQVAMPCIGNELVYKLWKRSVSKLAECFLDHRFTVCKYSEHDQKEYKQRTQFERNADIIDDETLNRGYMHYKTIDFSNFGSIVDTFKRIQDTESEEVLQATIEYTFSRKNIRNLIRSDLESDPRTKGLVSVAAEMIELWAKEVEYPSKTLEKIKLLNPLFDIQEMVYDFIGSLQHKCFDLGFTEITALAGDCVRYTPFGQVIPELTQFKPDNPDTEEKAVQRAVKLTGSILTILARCKLLKIVQAKDSVTGSITVECVSAITERTTQAIELSRVLPPLVCKPMKIRSNGMSGYLTHNSHRITNRLQAHNEDICLDVINAYNRNSFSLNEYIIENMVPQYTLPKKHEEMSMHKLKLDKSRWIRQTRITYQLVKMLLALGNKFFLEWFADYRGRQYSRGYHINPQGDDWRKAMLDFAEVETLQGADKYMELWEA